MVKQSQIIHYLSANKQSIGRNFGGYLPNHFQIQFLQVLMLFDDSFISESILC